LGNRPTAPGPSNALLVLAKSLQSISRDSDS
jgi:hypothetical protein